MGFRDQFIGSPLTGGSLPFFRLPETANERLAVLQHTVVTSLTSASTRIAERHDAATQILSEELSHQSRELRESNNAGFDSIKTAIDGLTDYLGAGLSEIRWAIEQQTTITKGILDALRNSLSNESRQFWDQGVTCYSANEYDMAKDRFERALQANNTNAFAYQYLGFIALAKDDAQNTQRNFELACKFADNNRQRALAHAHLARTHQALNDLENAVEHATAATKNDPERAGYWYHLAQLSSLTNDTNAMQEALRKTIVRDWHYWGIIAADTTFTPHNDIVQQLMDSMRNDEQQSAKYIVEACQEAINKCKPLVMNKETIESGQQTLNQLTALYATNNIHHLRDVNRDGHQLLQRIYNRAVQAIECEMRNADLENNKLRADYTTKRSASYFVQGFFWAIVPSLLSIIVSVQFTSIETPLGFFGIIIIPIISWIAATFHLETKYDNRARKPLFAHQALINDIQYRLDQMLALQRGHSPPPPMYPEPKFPTVKIKTLGERLPIGVIFLLLLIFFRGCSTLGTNSGFGMTGMLFFGVLGLIVLGTLLDRNEVQ